MPKGQYVRKTRKGPKVVEETHASAHVKIGTVDLEIPAELKKNVDFLRPKLLSFSDEFATITARKGDIAEPFMDSFTVFNHETGRSFVDFVRLIDPTVPANSE